MSSSHWEWGKGPSWELITRVLCLPVSPPVYNGSTPISCLNFRSSFLTKSSHFQAFFVLTQSFVHAYQIFSLPSIRCVQLSPKLIFLMQSPSQASGVIQSQGPKYLACLFPCSCVLLILLLLICLQVSECITLCCILPTWFLLPGSVFLPQLYL